MGSWSLPVMCMVQAHSGHSPPPIDADLRMLRRAIKTDRAPVPEDALQCTAFL